MPEEAQGRGRRNATIILVAFGLLATWIGIRVRQFGVYHQIGYLGLGVVLLVFGVGVGFARNWARLGAGLLCLILSAGELVVMIPGLHTSLEARVKSPGARVTLVIVAVGWLLMGLYFLRASTKRAFATARDAIAQGRIKPI